MNIKLIIATIIVTVMVFSCSKKINEPAYNTAVLAPLSIEFDNIAAGQKLQLNTTDYRYRNALGESYNVQVLQYFISNIKVHKADGTTYTVPQDSSYFLINEKHPESRFARVKVPEGDYTKITFTLGVDSVRNTMDISKRTGVLDPAGSMENSMYWTWNSGYIFFKMEGYSPVAPTSQTSPNKFYYHIGGYGGYSALTPTINNIKTITKDLTQRGVAQVRKERNANVHFFVDVDKIFSGKNKVSIATHYSVMFSEYSVNIADNFQEMFTHDHTEN